jgi:hypothetical protein
MTNGEAEDIRGGRARIFLLNFLLKGRLSCQRPDPGTGRKGINRYSGHLH